MSTALSVAVIALIAWLVGLAQGWRDGCRVGRHTERQHSLQDGWGRRFDACATCQWRCGASMIEREEWEDAER